MHWLIQLNIICTILLFVGMHNKHAIICGYRLYDKLLNIKIKEQSTVQPTQNMWQSADKIVNTVYFTILLFTKY